MPKFRVLLLFVLSLLFLTACTTEKVVLDNGTELPAKSNNLIENLKGVSEAIITGSENEKVEKLNQSNINSAGLGKTPVELVRSIDGNTGEFVMKEPYYYSNSSGNKKTFIKGESILVKYILIDAPLINQTEKKVHPYAKEASRYATEKLEKANEILLQFDEKLTDDAGRYLVYVFVDGKLLQELLLENGLARIDYINKSTLYLEKLRTAENFARSKSLNVWSIDGYVTGNGYTY